MAANDRDTASAVPYELLMSIQKGTMEYRYRGVSMLKNPFDIALYPLLLEELRPRTLIEIGSHKGGSAMWFADLAARLGFPMAVYSVDLAKVADVIEEEITFLQGDARKLGDVLDDRVLGGLAHPWLVVEDSDHQYQTTLAVLRFFDRWLSAGDYIVVEDGILSDMRAADTYDGGPERAIRTFLGKYGARYSIDRRYCDYFGRNVTWNVNGYIRCER